MTTTARNQFTAAVAANIPLCKEHFRLVLTLPSFAPTAAGQFIQIACNDEPTDVPIEQLELGPGRWPQPEGSELLEPQAILRRPFSLAGRRDRNGRVELDIIHRVVGLSTHWLAKLKVGDAVQILGPLGNRFKMPPPGGTALLVGGGVGIPPMIYLASQLAGKSTIAFAGAVCRDLLALTVTSDKQMCISEFAEFGIPTIVSTDDGSLGFRGYVTDALSAYLDEHQPRNVTIFTCGPEPMMKRVAQIALERNFPCQIAVERAMACGMGTCQSCCIRVKKTDPSRPPLAGKDWCYRLACTDGPIFTAEQLLW